MSKKGGGTVDKKDEISSLYKDLAALRPTEDFDPSPEDYEKAVKICNKILNLDPNDVTAFHCKVVALIQVTDQSEASIQLISTNDRPASSKIVSSKCLEPSLS